ncbi:hypothetical protein V491_04618, partial [Pseudogymnoascus sp. VKM F-3775]
KEGEVAVGAGDDVGDWAGGWGGRTGVGSGHRSPLSAKLQLTSKRLRPYSIVVIKRSHNKAEKLESGEEGVESGIEGSGESVESGTEGSVEEVVAETAVKGAESPKPEGDGWNMVCRPKVGDRVVGGGFVGVFRRVLD